MIGQDIADSVWACHFIQGFLEFLHGVGARRGGFGEQADGFLDQCRRSISGRCLDLDGFDFGDPKRAIVRPAVQIDSLNAVKHDVGGSVGLLDTGADESGGAPGENGIIRLADAGADAEHAVAVQGMFQHFAISFFEYEQREETTWKEVAVGQDHDRHFCREDDLILRVNGIHGRLEKEPKSGVTVKIRIESRLG